MNGQSKIAKWVVISETYSILYSLFEIFCLYLYVFNKLSGAVTTHVNPSIFRKSNQLLYLFFLKLGLTWW